MNTNIKHLPDAELAVMQALWQSDAPVTRPELDVLLAAEKDWAPTTILNLIARLDARGFITRIKQGKGYLYSAAVSKAAYLQQESNNVLTQMFDGSAKQFVAALHAGNALSHEDAKELADYLRQLQTESEE